MFEIMIRGAILAAAASLALTAPARADAPVIETGHGYTCDYTPGDTPVAADTITGEVRAKRDPGFTFDMARSRVPAQIGTGFGIAYSRTDADAELPALTLEITHPPMGDTGTTLQAWTAAHGDGPDYAEMYLFEADYERVPGTWTMRLMAGDTPILTRDFEVFLPSDTDAAECGPNVAD